MPFTSVNLIAVIVAAVASMAIGAMWYGPVFGKIFAKAIGMDQWTEEKRNDMMKKSRYYYLLQFAASILMFYVFAVILTALNMFTVAGGMIAALIVWIGIIVPVKFGEQLWGGKMILFVLGSGNMLLTMIAAGAIIGGWK